MSNFRGFGEPNSFSVFAFVKVLSLAEWYSMRASSPETESCESSGGRGIGFGGVELVVLELVVFDFGVVVVVMAKFGGGRGASIVVMLSFSTTSSCC